MTRGGPQEDIYQQIGLVDVPNKYGKFADEPGYMMIYDIC